MSYVGLGMTSGRSFLTLEADTPERFLDLAIAFLKEHPHGLVGRVVRDGIPIPGTWFEPEVQAMRRALCNS